MAGPWDPFNATPLLLGLQTLIQNDYCAVCIPGRPTQPAGEGRFISQDDRLLGCFVSQNHRLLERLVSQDYRLLGCLLSKDHSLGTYLIPGPHTVRKSSIPGSNGCWYV